MRILHYSLGLPPYRTGGLTTYCVDLMMSELQADHVIGIIWPGRIQRIQKEVSVKTLSMWNGIYNYEIINPLPVPMDEGIVYTELFMCSAGYDIYRTFIADFQPDVIHIHTLLGMHKDFLLAAREAHVKIVYTVHDYFGICPKVTLVSA